MPRLFTKNKSKYAAALTVYWMIPHKIRASTTTPIKNALVAPEEVTVFERLK
ncbi:hypothetical protein D3C81_1574600 [compost metagenome]